jgi:AraC-like DNA-binding protein
MLYLEKTPSAVLSPWVRMLWYCKAPQVAHGRERVLPNGCIQIILNLSGESLTDCGDDGTTNAKLDRAIVVGARARYEVVDTSDMAELAGIVIRPGGFARLFRERADLFFEQSISLDNIWRETRLVDGLCEASSPAEKLCRLERLLIGLLPPDALRSEMVDYAFYLFRRKHFSVAECARSVGVSARRLSQVFREEVGLAPKMWCRIHRFQAATRALHAGEDVAWSELALRCGYYDQSHFANDFRAFSGIDPTTYSALRGRWRNHVPMV